MTKELKKLLPTDAKVVVKKPYFFNGKEHEEHVAWHGGSIFASMSSFKQMMQTKEEYDESGPSIPRRKVW
jgi:actin